MPVPNAQNAVRFGQFELDLRTRQLKKNGAKVRLSQQPVQVLILLLEAPGEIVTREEFRRRLWSSDVFVDFDHGLNKCIQKLRDALGDSADSPRYIETIPRIGYRFIALAHEKRESADSPAETRAFETDIATVRVPAVRKGIGRLGIIAVLALGAVFVVAADRGWRAYTAPTAAHFVQLTHDGRDKRLVGTDGSRLYFMYTSAPDARDIAVMPLSGGQITVLPQYRNRYIATQISRNGSELLTIGQSVGSATGSLWLLPLPDGPPRRVGDLAADDARWSPDGQKLAFCKGSDVYIANADGTQAHKIATVPQEVVFAPTWAPDGKSIRVTGFNLIVQAGWIWEVNVDGSDLHRLFEGWGGAWSPSGKYYVFSRARELWAVPRYRNRISFFNRPFQLTTNPIELGEVTFSPDGNRLYMRGATERGELQRLDKVSGQWVPYLGGIQAEFADFSKDGQWVAYVTYPEGKLWRSRVDGTDRLQLSDLPLQHYLPRWSPDGKTIVFCTIDAKGPIRAYTISADGGVPAPLAPDDPEQQVDPTWSPDGSKILLSKEGGNPHPELRLYDLQNHRFDKVPGSETLSSGRWDPSGQHIVALGRSGVMIYDVARQSWLQIFSSALAWPTFSHDGQWIYGLGEKGGVWRVRLRDGKVEEVADCKGVKITGYFSYDMMMSPADEPMILRDVSVKDLYALDWKEP